MISWFNRMRLSMSVRGVDVAGNIHKGNPILNPSGKSWKTGKCPKCNIHGGVIFRSNNDAEVFVLACPKCNKYSWRKVHNKLVVAEG